MYIKDIGIYVDDKLNFKYQRSTIIEISTNKKIKRVLRTFFLRKLEVMRMMWRLLIQSHLDYDSLIGSPSKMKTYLEGKEVPLRNFSRKIQGMGNFNY